MDIVRGKTPAMVRKELWKYVLAYNLIRSVMATVARHDGLVPRMLSFTGVLQAVNAFGTALLFAATPAKPSLLTALYATICAHRVGQRPNRLEPRAVKRRPKPHPLLTIPRNQAQKNIRRISELLSRVVYGGSRGVLLHPEAILEGHGPA
jgi:hypothetical protein